MGKKEVLKKIQLMSIEEKIAMLSGAEEAYVRGFIEGALLGGQSRGQAKGLTAAPQKPGTHSAKGTRPRAGTSNFICR